MYIHRASRLTVPDVYSAVERGCRVGKLPRGLIGTVGDVAEELSAGSPVGGGNWVEPTLAFPRPDPVNRHMSLMMHLLFLTHTHRHTHIQKAPRVDG